VLFKGGREAPLAVGFNPSGTEDAIPVEQRWRAFYKTSLQGGLGSFVGIGRSATLWRTLNFGQTGTYNANRMEEPGPLGRVIQAGDVVMTDILGGPEPLPCTYWSFNGLPPSDNNALNPAYAICMGKRAQVHFIQECFDTNKIRIWAGFVEDVQINLQTEFVECFPYAEFLITDCGEYQAAPFVGLNKKCFAYCPPGRLKPPTASEPLTSMEEFGDQWQLLFNT